MNGRLRLEPAALSTIEARSVCIIKPSSLGDVVQALPLLPALRARFPEARISWVVNRGLADLLRPLPLLAEVIPFEREALRSASRGTLRGMLDFLKHLRAKGFDLAIDLQGLFRSGLMCQATAASRRIGLASAREFAGVFYTDVAPDLPKEQNAVVRYWKVAEMLGVGGCAKQFPLALSDAERDWARRQIGNRPGAIVGVSPGARWATKRWPAARFAEAVNRAWKSSAATAVVFGGRDEVAVGAEVEAALAIPCVNVCGQTSLRQLAAMLERCDLLLTNDSGPMHLAAAVGTPTVSVFTCTSPLRASPFGTGHEHAATQIWCKASYLRNCDRMECLNDLPVERIVPLLESAAIHGDAEHRRRVA